jgi:hypothetical protein
MTEHEKQIPIWFFIGALLALYGLLIAGAGIYGWMNPPPPEQMVKLWNLHADLWWGILLVIFGLIYVVKFWPSKPEGLTGKIEEPEPASSTEKS